MKNMIDVMHSRAWGRLLLLGFATIGVSLLFLAVWLTWTTTFKPSLQEILKALGGGV